MRFFYSILFHLIFVIRYQRCFSPVNPLQATHQLWPAPLTRTWQTVWLSSSPPWNRSLPERPALVQPPTSTPSWRTVVSWLRVGPLATCVMLKSRAIQAAMGGRWSRISSQCCPKSPCRITHTHAMWYIYTHVSHMQPHLHFGLMHQSHSLPSTNIRRPSLPRVDFSFNCYSREVLTIRNEWEF